MPPYFKTKNFASFVRQLNMYSFYKVKTKRNRQEFRHPFFRRDQPDDLKYIKRKNVNKKMRNTCGSKIMDDKISQQKTNIREQIDKLKGLLEFIAEQNQALEQTNTNILTQLFNARSFCESQLREFISMIFVTLKVPNAKLMNELRDYLAGLKIDMATLPIHALISSNVANFESYLRNHSNRSLDIQEAMENILEIYKSHLPEENFDRDELSTSDKMLSEDREQVLALADNPMNKYTPINSKEDLNASSEIHNMSLTPINLTFYATKPQTYIHKNSFLDSIKNDNMTEDLSRADFLFTHYNSERDYDLVSLSEFMYTPVTPLFQEDI